jgi:hypothetical protein
VDFQSLLDYATLWHTIARVKLSFIQLSGFAVNWARMKLNDDDLRKLESVIQCAPDASPVMRGTGGLRKVRFVPGSSSGGKSGGARVCYAYFPEFGLVYLCAVFAKNVKANLNAAECEAFRKVLDSIRRYLRDNWPKGWTP